MGKIAVGRLGALLEGALALICCVICCGAPGHHGALAQSIGYHPQFNLGFNPYNSPVFGYGLGLPFGAYNMSPTRNPWLVGAAPQVNLFDKSGLMSKLHAKAFFKKLATSQPLSTGYYGLKDKMNLMKYPEFAYTPYGASYGYGKHYGAALVPNNPYKSTYSDYYDSQTPVGLPGKSHSALGHVKHIEPDSIPIGGRPHDVAESHTITSIKPVYSHYLKPILKAGALLTTAALLGKKILDVPIRLNPTGMILNEIKP